MNAPGRHILVIKLGALGDFIQALGPMAAIRAHHAQDHITLLTTAPYADLARASGYFDDVRIDSRPEWYDPAGWMNLRRMLNSGDFNLVYDLQNNDRTSFYFQLFSPKPEWSGIARGASHRNTAAERTAGKAYDGHVQTLALAGISDISPDRLEWMKGTKNFAGLKPPYILIVAGASPRHPEKRWRAESFAAFCGMLLRSGYQPVLVGGADEAALNRSIGQSAAGCLDLSAQTSLFDLPALARMAAGAIGNDTGPMHLIAPTGCRSIILFSGKSNPARHAPAGDNVIAIQKQDLKDLDVQDVWKAFAAQHSIV